jgi:hypothetical protein
VDSSATTEGVKCEVARIRDDTNTFWADYALASYNAGSPMNGAGVDLPLALRAVGYRLVMTYDRTASVACVAKADDDVTTGPRAVLPIAPPPTPGSISLDSFDLATRFDYVVVYDRMP